MAGSLLVVLSSFIGWLLLDTVVWVVAFLILAWFKRREWIEQSWLGRYPPKAVLGRAPCHLKGVDDYSPIRVPEVCRPATAEAVARANYGLRVGKFEFEVDEGESRFQASQGMTDDTVGERVIDRLISTTMAMLDMYLPAFLSVIYGNELPKDAIRCAEAGRCGHGETESCGQDTD